MSNRRILVVDDEEGMLEVCRDTLRRLEEVEVCTEQASAKALQRLDGERFDLLLSDIRMPGLDGIALLKHVRERDPAMPVIMLTAFPSVETAISAMKLGAYDYLVKPFEPEDLMAKARRALERKVLGEENRLLARQVERPYRFGNIVGQSQAMQSIFEIIGRVAETDADVLITGESGTGKELVARSIHARSRRKAGKFVPVDCGAIPETLLENELFGHERGAFTGAHAASMGLLEFARGGTFFLDEICELSTPLQAKLLRALQERCFRRIGNKEEISVDVRIVAATNRDVAREVQEKHLREDLFYRINVVRVALPPLREREGDVALLVHHFIERFGRELGKSVTGIDPEALEILSRYRWPGNVRELQNVLKRAIVMARGQVLDAADLPDEVVVGSEESGTVAGSEFYRLRAQRMATFERTYFRQLLEKHGGDVLTAAQSIRMPRTTLYRFLKRHQLTTEAFKAKAGS